MKIITGVNVLEVPYKEVYEIYKNNRPHDLIPISINGDDEYIPAEVLVEKIYGKRFVDFWGNEIILGISKECQKLIGLPFEAFDNMEESFSIIHSQNIEYRKELKKIKQMNFWGRIKFLIKGKVE